jgi:hypothetical protein
VNEVTDRQTDKDGQISALKSIKVRPDIAAESRAQFFSLFENFFGSFESRSQGDKMSLLKTRPKCSPTHFLL